MSRGLAYSKGLKVESLPKGSGVGVVEYPIFSSIVKILWDV
jgi:hypothetical protein